MVKFDARKNWWIVVAAGIVVGTAGLLLVEQQMPNNQVLGSVLFLVLTGAVFSWAYSINRQGLWWAIIPGLAAFVIIAAILADLVIGKDPLNDWASVLVIGIGTAIIAAVVARPDARRVLIIVAAFITGLGILMAPIMIIVKLVLIAALVVAASFILWSYRSVPARS